MIKFFVFLIIISSPYLVNAAEPDYVREKNIFEQITSLEFEADILDINTVSGENFKMVVDSSGDKIPVLLLHGRGLYPNEPLVMNPLREALKENFDIFSIQLPVLYKNAKYYEYKKLFSYSDERIKSSIDYLSRSYKKIIVIAHSCGSHMLFSFIKKYDITNIDAIILLGAGAVDKGQKVDSYLDYKRYGIDILNIYGEFDHQSVIKHGNYFQSLNDDNLEQKVIIESDHYYRDSVDYMVSEVNKWLKSR